MFSLGRLRRETSLKKQWPAALLFLAGCLKAGLTIEEGLKLLAREAPEPLRTHLAAAGLNQENWVPVNVLIERLVRGEELALSRAALLFSHRAGGQASPVLEQCAKTLQTKLEMEERLRTLTAQNRLSAWIVGLTPFGLLFAFSMLSPDYVAPLFQTRLGMMALGVSAALVGVGLKWVQRMVRLE